jgi:hypothetical protein
VPCGAVVLARPSSRGPAGLCMAPPPAAVIECCQDFAPMRCDGAMAESVFKAPSKSPKSGRKGGADRWQPTRWQPIVCRCGVPAFHDRPCNAHAPLRSSWSQPAARPDVRRRQCGARASSCRVAARCGASPDDSGVTVRAAPPPRYISAAASPIDSNQACPATNPPINIQKTVISA